MDQALRDGLQRFRDDLVVLGEQVPFETVVRKHLAVLLALRKTALTWPQIARLLHGASIHRPNGGLFSPDQLRSVTSRQSKRADTVGRRDGGLPSPILNTLTQADAPAVQGPTIQRPVAASNHGALPRPAGGMDPAKAQLIKDRMAKETAIRARLKATER